MIRGGKTTKECGEEAKRNRKREKKLRKDLMKSESSSLPMEVRRDGGGVHTIFPFQHTPNLVSLLLSAWEEIYNEDWSP